jgi:hypothetical protein
LTFSNDVSSTGLINLSENPLDPSTRPATSNPNFYGTNQTGSMALVLPVGTNTSGAVSNMSANVDAILQVPPAGLSPTSATGSNYLYNKADMIILISNGSVTVTSGVAVNNQATVISNAAWSQWLSTNASTQFYDARDQLTVQTTDIDVGKLTSWSATNSTLRTALAGVRGSASADVQSIFVADMRATSNAVITTNIALYTNNVFTNTTPYLSYPANNSFLPPVTTNIVLTTNSTQPGSGTYLGSYTHANGVYIYELIVGYSYQHITGVVTNYDYTTNWNIVSQSGIVLTNGAELPPQGLAVVTPDPAYIVGNYNVSTNGTPANLGTHNTSQTYPAAIYSDATTILSPSWNPANNLSASHSLQNASSDTVNAAILTGNVPSNDVTYSGGVENFPRFLESWSGDTFTYNGSMVCMFNSQIASAPWPGTGTVYNPPTRDWAFDLNFNNPSKLPPLTPRVNYVNRASWTFLAPFATQF